MSETAARRPIFHPAPNQSMGKKIRPPAVTLGVTATPPPLPLKEKQRQTLLVCCVRKFLIEKELFAQIIRPTGRHRVEE